MWSTLTPLGKGIATAVAVALLIGIFFVAKCSYDRSVVNQHEAKVEQQAKAANDQAANERANDAISQSKNEQEAHDVIQAQPDRPISPTSHALACERLSKLGRHPASCS